MTPDTCHIPFLLNLLRVQPSGGMSHAADELQLEWRGPCQRSATQQSKPCGPSPCGLTKHVQTKPRHPDAGGHSEGQGSSSGGFEVPLGKGALLQPYLLKIKAMTKSGFTLTLQSHSFPGGYG